MSQQDPNSDSANTGFLFRGPAGWFTLQVPAELRLEQDEAFIELKAASSQKTNVADPNSASTNKVNTDAATWSMTLYSAWVEDQKADSQVNAFDPSTLFPIVSQVHPSPPINVSGKTQAWQGISVQPSKGAWWSGLFRRRQTYSWRLWIVEYESIIVVASLQSKACFPLPDDVVESCQQVLNSLCFNDRLAKPPELFRREVLQLSKTHFPLLDSKALGSFSIQVADSEINLANFYRSYLLEPDSIKRIVLPGITAMVRIQEWGPEQLLPPLEEVADRIMPMLYPAADQADETPVNQLEDFVRMPWVGGLSIMFVLDDDDTYRFVHPEMLIRWGMNSEQLMQVALHNLEDYADNNPLEVRMVGDESDAKMLMPSTPNAYNSVRLLGEQLSGRLRDLLGPELIVGVPNRDFFVAVSLKDLELVQQVQDRVTHDFQSMHHPLTSRLLVISADGVSEYCED